MKKNPVIMLVFISLIFIGCSSTPAQQPWNEGRWNIYGFFDPEQDVRITDFYDDFDPETMGYTEEDLFWYRRVDRGTILIDEFLESVVVYLGHTREGIEFCTLGDMDGLYDTDRPSKTVVIKVTDIQNFSRNLDKYTVLRIRYRYFYRPVYASQNQVPSSISNRKVSQANSLGLMGISEFFLDEYEIIGKLDVPQSQISRGLQRIGDVFSAVIRGQIEL